MIQWNLEANMGKTRVSKGLSALVKKTANLDQVSVTTNALPMRMVVASRKFVFQTRTSSKAPPIKFAACKN